MEGALTAAAELRFKSNVLSGFDAGAGATLFDLSALQVRCWGSRI